MLMDDMNLTSDDFLFTCTKTHIFYSPLPPKKKQNQLSFGPKIWKIFITPPKKKIIWLPVDEGDPKVGGVIFLLLM